MYDVHCIYIYIQLHNVQCTCTCMMYIYMYCGFSCAEGLGKREAKKLVSSASATPTKNGAGPATVVNAARYHIASELLQTERNFVDILSLIVQV